MLFLERIYRFLTHLCAPEKPSNIGGQVRSWELSCVPPLFLSFFRYSLPNFRGGDYKCTNVIAIDLCIQIARAALQVRQSKVREVLIASSAVVMFSVDNRCKLQFTQKRLPPVTTLCSIIIIGLCFNT